MQAIFKQFGVPTLIILLAAAVVSVAILPLAGTEWAEGFRMSAVIVSEDEGAVGGIVTIIGPLIKVAALMGIGALLTALGRRLARIRR